MNTKLGAPDRNDGFVERLEPWLLRAIALVTILTMSLLIL